MAASRRRPAGPWHQRHPTITLASIATAIGILAVVGPWVTGWISQYETKADAKLHADHDQQQMAWILAGQARMEALVMRNRVNDCLALGNKATTQERIACRQYEQEFNDASLRANEARSKAMDANKERR